MGENFVGYCIAHQPAVPILWYTSDQKKASERLNGSLVPMVQQSDLSDRIKSTDEENGRKTGKTASKLEWRGGGSLKAFGAQSDANFREAFAQVVIRDEIDLWPLSGRDGDPLAASYARTFGFEDVRKVLDLSTPTIKGLSKIWEQYLRGDQRKYFVRCLKCKHPQELRWRRENKETGEVTGITWDLTPETKQLIKGSSRYLCSACGHAHREADKFRFFALDNAEWVPTATPVSPDVWSYHLPSLYSLMRSWDSCVQLWLEAWDVTAGKPRDMGKLQQFYNDVLAEPFELTGDKLNFETVSSHRKQEYKLGELPNRYAIQSAGSPIQFVTCTVDVQKSFLSVATWGWAKGRRGFLLDYLKFEGSTEHIDTPETWGELAKLIETKVYVSDDGKAYPIALTLVDSGYLPTVVYAFVGQWGSGVIAIRGEANPKKADANRLFSQMHTPLGDRAFEIAVNAYKERLHLSLQRTWEPSWGPQHEDHLSFPSNLSDEQLKELTVEKRVEEIDPRTRQRKGWRWHRPSGSRNELWDLAVYASCSVDMLAWGYCRHQLGLDQVLWGEFWSYTDRGVYFKQVA